MYTLQAELNWLVNVCGLQILFFSLFGPDHKDHTSDSESKQFGVNSVTVDPVSIEFFVVILQPTQLSIYRLHILYTRIDWRSPSFSESIVAHLHPSRHDQ